MTLRYKKVEQGIAQFRMEHNHVNLSEEALEFLDGTMLGDSSIERRGSVQDFLDYIGDPSGVVKECYGYKWKPILNLGKNGKVRKAGDKPSDEAVRAIRESSLPQIKLAAQYGVGKSTIGRIKNN